MKNWQKYWLYFIIVFSIFHLVRDALQDLGIKVFLSEILTKQPVNIKVSSFLWMVLNGYLIAVIEIFLSFFCLKRRKFGKIGFLTIFIIGIFLAGWLFYWFFL